MQKHAFSLETRKTMACKRGERRGRRRIAGEETKEEKTSFVGRCSRTQDERFVPTWKARVQMRRCATSTCTYAILRLNSSRERTQHFALGHARPRSTSYHPNCTCLERAELVGYIQKCFKRGLENERCTCFLT